MPQNHVRLNCNNVGVTPQIEAAAAKLRASVSCGLTKGDARYEVDFSTVDALHEVERRQEPKIATDGSRAYSRDQVKEYNAVLDRVKQQFEGALYRSGLIDAVGQQVDRQPVIKMTARER